VVSAPGGTGPGRVQPRKAEEVSSDIALIVIRLLS
jgi:hypothetical protein